MLITVMFRTVNSSPFLGAFGSENENALSKRLCQLDAYLSYKNNSPGASHDEVAQNQAENGVGGITRLVTNSGDYSSRTGSSTSFGRPRSASSHTRNIGNEVSSHCGELFFENIPFLKLSHSSFVHLGFSIFVVRF